MHDLDPKSPYVGNFHHGHHCGTSDVPMIETSTKNRIGRWNSQPDMSSSDSVGMALKDLNALKAWRKGKADECLAKLNSIIERAEDEMGSLDSDSLHDLRSVGKLEKMPSVRRAISDTTISLRAKLQLNGVPSTPELCALQAILPKQVCLFPYREFHVIVRLIQFTPDDDVATNPLAIDQITIDERESDSARERRSEEGGCHRQHAPQARRRTKLTYTCNTPTHPHRVEFESKRN